jgi:hypothetical protein
VHLAFVIEIRRAMEVGVAESWQLCRATAGWGVGRSPFCHVS